MTTKQSIITASAVGVLGLSGILGVQAVSADDTNSSENPMSSLVQKIAEKFNLNQDEVQAVFDEQRNEMHAQMETREEDRLQQAIDDGEITSEQKDKIIAKRQELQNEREANRDAMQDMTDEERRNAMEQQRDELEQWAEDNDIPLDYLHGGFGRHGHRGSFGGPGM